VGKKKHIVCTQDTGTRDGALFYITPYKPHTLGGWISRREKMRKRELFRNPYLLIVVEFDTCTHIYTHLHI
jgi:hypothetical protein